MNMAVSPRLRRLLAIALLLLVIALPYHLGLRPILAAHRAYDERLAEMSTLLAEFRRSGANLGELQSSLETLQRRPTLQTLYFTGESEALVAAQLQDVVKQTIERTGGVLDSAQTLPVEQDGQVRRVAVRIRMRGTTENLFLALYELESKEPYLFLDSVDISAAPVRRRIRTRGTPPSEETNLRIGFEVFGYMRDA